MPERILIPFDGSPQSYEALEYAFEEFPDGELTLLNVIDPVEAGYSAGAGIPSYSEEWYEGAKREAEELFEEAQERADEVGITLRTLEEVGRPAATIVDVAEDEAFDQIVMGSHGRSGVSRIVLGSVAESVVRKSPVPVTVVR